MTLPEPPFFECLVSDIFRCNFFKRTKDDEGPNGGEFGLAQAFFIEVPPGREFRIRFVEFLTDTCVFQRHAKAGNYV